jgi:hypothetical protein
MKSQYKDSVKEMAQACKALRMNPENPIDISFGDFVQKRFGVSMNSFYEDLGINISIDTVQNIFTLPDESVRWLIPEIIRDALRLGLRKAPIWADLIAAEQTIQNPSVTIPHLNMSDAAPKYVGEGETITKGTISFGQKTLKVRKMGRGIAIPYEVANYVTINVMGIFLQDFGVKLNHGIDALLIDVLINGEQTNGSESAPVVGVASISNFTYVDLLRVWVRMARIGRAPFGILGGEDAAIATMNLDEFKTPQNTGATFKRLDMRTPLPQSSAYYIHGAVPTDQQIVVDRSSAVIKYNAQPLLVEEDRIVSKQLLETYASLTTGFGIVFRDARVIIDQSLDFAVQGFPSYMDVDPLEQVTIE